MLLSFEIEIAGVFMLELVRTEFLVAKWRVTRKPTGVARTCANRYGGCTGTWEDLLSPTGEMGGRPYQESPGCSAVIAAERSEKQSTVGTAKRRKRS